MKLKRIISLLLLAVYLFTAAGQALASMSCDCVAMKSRTAHRCCNHCTHFDDGISSKQTLRAPCCTNHHSTQIELYTGTSSVGEKLTRNIVLDLPPALLAEAPAVADTPAFREKTAQRRAPFAQRGHQLSSGLRAPPASV